MKNSKKNELFHFTSLMGISGVFSKLLSIPHSIIFAKFLMPSGYGVLQLIKVMISYFAYTQMGILQAMSRNVPRAYANNEIDKAKRIKDLSFTWLFGITIITLIILWIVFLFNDKLQGQLTSMEMILLTITLIFSRINAFIKPLLKAEGKFIIIGKALLYKSILAPIVGMGLVYYMNLPGAIIALAFDQFLQTMASLYFYRDYSPSFYFNRSLFVAQISKGFLIYLNRFSETIISSLTILLIGIYYSSSDVGVFSFGIVSLIAVQKYSVPIRIYIYRDIMKMKGSEDKNNVYYQKLFKLPHLFNLLLNTVLLVLFATVYFTIINLFLPKYIESIPVIYVSVFGLIIYNARVFFGQFLDATDQLVRRTIFIFIGAGIGVLMSFLFLINKMPLFYIAISCGTGFCIISILMIAFVYYQVSKSLYKTVSMLFNIIIIAIINTIFIYLYSEISLLPIQKEMNFANVLLSLLDLFFKIIIILALNYILFSILFQKMNFRNEMNKIGIFLLKKAKIL